MKFSRFEQFPPEGGGCTLGFARIWWVLGLLSRLIFHVFLCSLPKSLMLDGLWPLHVAAKRFWLGFVLVEKGTDRYFVRYIL